MKSSDAFKKTKIIEGMQEAKRKIDKIRNTEKSDTARMDNKNFYRKAKKK